MFAVNPIKKKKGSSSINGNNNNNNASSGESGQVLTRRRSSAASPPTTVDLSGIRVHFPFRPYKVQEDYMSKVMNALLNSENALLESPTGTGKTLCLLCACLAWQRHTVCNQKEAKDVELLTAAAASQTANPDMNNDDDNNNNSNEAARNLSTPTIIYASRTHSQLSQVVRELRNTRYRPNHAVVGAREHMCLNPKVKTSTATSSDINHNCHKLGVDRKCSYRNRLEGFTAPQTESALTQPVMDMEDLLEMGKQHKVCPFYHTRSQLAKAELIFVPYNYLFDQNARKTTLQDVNWKNAVVIFDEAHNLESFCSDSASFDLSNTDLAGCVAEIQRALNYAEAVPEQAAELDPSSLLKLKALFLELEEYLINMRSATTAYAGEFIMEFLQQGGKITHGNQHLLVAELKKVNDFILDRQGTGGSGRGAPRLEHFCHCLSRVFCDPLESRCYARAQSYRVHVSAKTAATPSRSSYGGGGGNVNKENTVNRTISYWCFAPALAMEELSSLQVRSILVTSGTLSPLPSYRMELGLPFPHQLENPHIVKNEQIHVRVIGKGVSGKPLTSSYERRQQADYYPELGNTLVALSKVIPDGMLIFFPSYGVMQTCLERWGGPSSNTGGRGNKHQGGSNFFAARARKKSSQQSFSFPMTALGFQSSSTPSTPWKRLLATKSIVVEPRSSADLNEAIADFHRYLSMPKSKGCIVMGVCRGKISEGIDFRHEQSRAVVIMGLPFPPSFDPKVKMKREYLDGARARANIRPSDTGGFSTNELDKNKSLSTNVDRLSGHDWYSQQAHRAVNQAVGRVIRDRTDYGAVLLLDNRFGQPRNKEGLSKWVRPHVQPDEGFGKALRPLIEFYKESKAFTQKFKEDEARRAAVAAAATSNAELEEEELLTSKVAVISRRKQDAESTGAADNYVAPKQIIARLDDADSNESAHRSKPANLFSSTGGGGKAKSTAAREGYASIFAASSAPRRPPTSKAKTSSKTLAMRFMTKIKTALSAEDQSTLRKGIVQLKSHGDASNIQAFLETAGQLLTIIIDTEGFDPVTFASGDCMLSDFFLLLPKAHCKDVEEEAMAMVFRMSAFGKSCHQMITSIEFSRLHIAMQKLMRWLWIEKNAMADGHTNARAYLEHAKYVFSIVASSAASSGKVFALFLKLVPEKYEANTRTLYRELVAQKNVAKMKVMERRKQGEDSIDSRRFATSVFPRVKEERATSAAVGNAPKANGSGGGKRAITITSPSAEPTSGNPYARPSKRPANTASSSVAPTTKAKTLAMKSFVQSIESSNPYTKKSSWERATALGRAKANAKASSASSSHNLECPICQESPSATNLLMADCGHVACRGCWKKWLSKSSHCFTCRKPTTAASLARTVFCDGK